MGVVVKQCSGTGWSCQGFGIKGVEIEGKGEGERCAMEGQIWLILTE